MFVLNNRFMVVHSNRPTQSPNGRIFTCDLLFTRISFNS